MAYNYSRRRSRRSSTYGRRPNYSAPYQSRSTYARPRVVYVDRKYKKKKRTQRQPRPLYPLVAVAPAATAAAGLANAGVPVDNMEIGDRAKRERTA